MFKMSLRCKEIREQIFCVLSKTTSILVSFFQGGVKAVVWTDAVQAVMMLACIALVAMKGVAEVGGLGEVWRRNLETTRLEAPV